MHRWRGKVPDPVQFQTQQDKLRALSGELLRRYKRELEAEISDPERLAAVYGSGFTSSDAQRQAEIVAVLATEMIKVPNAQVNVLTVQHQECVAAVHDNVAVHGLPPVPATDGFCQHVIATGREMAVSEALEHPLVCDTQVAIDGDVISYLGVPIANRHGYIIGVLCVFQSAARDWTSTDVAMLTQLSMVLTRAIS